MSFLKSLPKPPIKELPISTVILYKGLRYFVCSYHGLPNTNRLACENYGHYITTDDIDNIKPEEYEYIYHPAQKYDEEHTETLTQILKSIKSNNKKKEKVKKILD